MKILHVITRLVQGGAQQNTVMCCKAQAQAGHQVHLAYGPISGPEGSLLESAKASGAQLHEVASMIRSVRPSADKKCVAELRQLISQIKPDVVHTHSSKAGIVGRAAAWEERTPAIIHTIHGLPFHSRQSFTFNRLYIGAERWAAKRCHKLVGITRAMIDAFDKYNIGKSSQYEVVPSGVEIDRFALSPEQHAAFRTQTREAMNIPADVPVIGIVARIDKLKGYDDLLNILPEMRRRYPNVHALLVGDGNYRKVIETRISFSGLQEYVAMTGLVPPDQVSRYMAAMDVMVLPSYQEGQGRTLVEALLAGCGIVGYDVGGIGEVCIDQQTGRLVKKKRWKPLCDAVDWMLQNPARRAQLVQQGQEHVRQHFDAQIMYKRLLEIYEQVLSRAVQEV